MSSNNVKFAPYADVAVHQSIEFDDNGVFRRMLDWKQDYSYSIPVRTNSNSSQSTEENSTQLHYPSSPLAPSLSSSSLTSTSTTATAVSSSFSLSSSSSTGSTSSSSSSSPLSQSVSSSYANGTNTYRNLSDTTYDYPSSSSSSSSTSVASAATNDSNLPRIKKRIDIDGWHIKADSCIYKGPYEHSSPVIAWPGDTVITDDTKHSETYILSSTEVLTMNGTLYNLGDIDPLMYPLIVRMYPGYDPYNPLRKGNEPIMLLAEKFIYQIASTVRSLGSIVNELQEHIYGIVKGNNDIEDQITEQFNAIKDTFGSMGVLLNTTNTNDSTGYHDGMQ